MKRPKCVLLHLAALRTPGRRVHVPGVRGRTVRAGGKGNEVSREEKPKNNECQAADIDFLIQGGAVETSLLNRWSTRY